MLPVKGFQKMSMVDYPGKLCSVVFVANCNFRCPYCQNPDLILNYRNLPSIPERKVLEYLKKRRKWVDGVCITGGEPCLHEDLAGFIRKLKSMRFLVKLDTNGSNPEILGDLIRNRFLDYIAMDIKAPLKRYSEVAGVKVNVLNVRKSAALVMKSGIDYEFRTTVLPRLFGEDDMVSIGRWLKGARLYCIHQFRSLVTLDKAYQKEKAYPEEKLWEFARIAGPYFDRVEVRV
jgi:pyruvate formate lyase activating enzyme